MTKLANSFLLLHDVIAIMHVNSEAKVLPNAASTGGRRFPYLNVIFAFFTSFQRHCLVRHLHFFCIRNKVHPVLFFFNRTEILNFESNTEPSKSIEKYRYLGESLHPYTIASQNVYSQFIEKIWDNCFNRRWKTNESEIKICEKRMSLLQK